MTTRKYSSRSQQTTLTGAVTSTGTTIVVVSGSALLGGATVAAGETFTVVIDPDTALEEIVDVTAVSTNTLTIVRAIDTSPATGQAHSAGAVVRHMAIGRDYRDANLHQETTAAGAGTAHGIPLNTVVLTSDTGTVSNGMIANSGVTTSKIADLNVTTGKIADSAITSSKIADLGIATGDIADSAITSAKIADLTIVAGDIADGAITSAKIADLTIATGDIADSAISTAKITDSAITSAKIADGAITNVDVNSSAQIAYSKLTLTNTITNADINATAAIDKTKISGIAVTIADTGTVTSIMIANDTIVNADINTAAAIDKTKISGIAITAADTGTVTSTMIADGTIVSGDISASAAIPMSKLSIDPTERANHTGTQLASTISNLDTTIKSYKVTDLTAPTTSVSVNSQTITNVATPVNSTDAATKAYADTKIASTLIGANSGVAPLDVNGKVPLDHIPATAIAEVFVVTSQSEMLAISGVGVGDIAIRTDLNKSFILRETPGTTLSNWNELLTPTDIVLSVDGQVGVVSLSTTYATVANAANKLPLAGGTMSGAIAMANNKITGLGAPTTTGDAATKDYADTKLALSGGSLTGVLDMGSNKITSVATPTISTDASNKAYSDTKLPLAGGTLTGPLAMSANKITGLADPTNLTDAMTLNYFNSAALAPSNLTGPITSIGPATSIASQTGTGTKFVVDTSPTLVTPELGVATATSINGTVIPASKTLVATDSTTYVVPPQASNSGKYLTTNGTTSSWASVDALPSQTGNSGKYLTTNGSSASWSTIATDPIPQILMLGGM